jgi:uncharacterized protein (DUF1330 family)
MSGYVISNYTLNDQEKYEKYPQAVLATVQQYGGKYIIRDDDAKVKGCPHKRLVVIEFESEEAAWRWYHLNTAPSSITVRKHQKAGGLLFQGL